jgi:hypothetical protein|tara:strand:- start:552 stop:1730 length:1179 start_codon:yes stop_codon:yes gene_type:complete
MVFGLMEADFYVTEVYPERIYPGETTNLSITIKNLSPEDATYLKITLDPNDTSPIDPIGTSKKYLNQMEKAVRSAEYFGVVSQNDELTLSFPIYANLDATEDVYMTPLLLEWKNVNLQDASQTLQVEIYVKGEPALKIAKVRTDPIEFKSDTENSDIIITVENAGKAIAKSVRLTLSLNSPFSKAYSNSNSDFVAEIVTDKTHDFTVSVDIDEKTPAGSYSFPITMTYRGEENEYSLTEEITLIVESEATFDIKEVKSNPETLNQGDVFRVNVLIVNTGQRNAEAVKAVLKTKSYFSGVKTDYLGDIEIGESKLATFELTADRDTIPDNYENDIKIIWEESGKRIEEIDSFAITVHGNQSNIGAPTKLVGGLAILFIVAVLVIWRRRGGGDD